MRAEEKDLQPSAPESAATSADPAPPKLAGRLRRWLIASLALAAFVVALVLLWDWNWFKPLAERYATTLTGRAVHIDGDLDVRLSMTPRVTLNQLRMDEPAGLQRGTMASAQQLQFRIDLRALLRSETVLPDVSVTRPVAHFELRADGVDNWTFPERTSPPPLIRRFTIRDGLLTYREPARQTDLAVSMQTEGAARRGGLAPVVFHGKGLYRGNAFTLEGSADSPLGLQDSTTPYRIDASATAGTTHAHASGALRNPFHLQDFDVDFALSGPDLSQLRRLMGVLMPETPPYRVHGRLAHKGHVWSYHDFRGVVGGSDLSGELVIDNRGQRRLLTADLASRRLDVHDLAGFVGAPAHANPAKAQTSKQAQEAAKAQQSDRLLPNRDFDLAGLRSMDVDVALKARAVSGTPVPLSDFSTRLVLRDGVVRLHPFDFRAAGGQVNARVAMDASRTAIATSAKIRARGIDVAQLVPDVPAIQRSAGKLGADVDLRGTGNSVAKMVATSSGHVDAGMGGGMISRLLMARAALDIARILKFKIAGDHDEPVLCMLGDFDARDGVWTARRLEFAAQDTLIRGEGKLDMRDESLDLTLRVKPRGISLLSLRSPLHVAGSLRRPDIRPDYRRIGLRGVAVAVLASIAPPAGEIGLIDIGGGKDNECSQPGTGRATAR